MRLKSHDEWGQKNIRVWSLQLKMCRKCFKKYSFSRKNSLKSFFFQKVNKINYSCILKILRSAFKFFENISYFRILNFKIENRLHFEHLWNLPCFTLLNSPRGGASQHMSLTDLIVKISARIWARKIYMVLYQFWGVPTLWILNNLTKVDFRHSI